MKKREEKEIKWETYLRIGERTLGWYIIFFLVMIGLIIFGWLSRNFLFIFLVLLGGIFILFFRKEGQIIKCELNEEEFLINGRENVYKYKDLLGFTILEENDDTFLVLHTQNKLVPYLKVHFPKEYKEKIETFLESRLKRLEYEENFWDVLWEKLKF
jgi:hypothetical protein